MEDHEAARRARAEAAAERERTLAANLASMRENEGLRLARAKSLATLSAKRCEELELEQAKARMERQVRTRKACITQAKLYEVEHRAKALHRPADETRTFLTRIGSEADFGF